MNTRHDSATVLPASANVAATAQPGQTVVVRIWDLPTRAFHWLLVLTVISLFVTGQIGGDALLWHGWLGLLAGALLVFRLLWGLIGGYWSRLGRFLYSPAAIFRYVKNQTLPGERFDVGHNPLGSLSVWALLLLLLAQVGTGLVADDEIAFTGPLYGFVSNATAALATTWHKGPGKLALIVLVSLHVGAIVYYLWRKKNNLVRPMLTGDKRLPPGVPASADGAKNRLAAAALLLLCLALAWSVQVLGGAAV